MSDSTGAIDVETLVDDLRRRVERARASGEYGTDVGSGPIAPLEPERRLRFRPEVGYSTKPVVGKPITAAKQVLLKLQRQALDDLAAQTDAAVAHSEATARQLHGAAERRADEADHRVDELQARIESLEAELARLEPASRLSRLERALRSAPRAESAPSPAPASAAPDSEPATAALDYLLFEARFRGSEASVRERLATHMDVLRDRRRVVDLGCGRGELLALLREAGVESYGVDSEPDFVEQCRERGLDVREGDAIAHLESLEPGSVDAVVSTHMVEHLPPAVLGRLVRAARDVLQGGGVLILETPNPESLVAGSINFHRDPTHLRPIHPDTLAFVCESAGFATSEIVRLAPFGERERLPAAPAGDPGAEYLNEIIERLNAVLFGHQDYAVVATVEP